MVALSHYFDEIKKYPLLSVTREKEVCLAKEEAFEALRAHVLSYPAAREMILDLWRNAKSNFKATNKLTEEYGNIQFDSKDLTEQIDSNLTAALTDSTNPAQYFIRAGLSKSIYIDVAKKLIDSTPDLEPYLAKFLYYRDLLVNSNLLLVINFAKNFQVHGVPLDDIIQEGNLGLLRATEKFDPRRGIKFSTYACWWIRQNLINLVKTQSKTIRLPSHIHNLLTKIKKLHAEYDNNHKREATPQEISMELGIPVSEVIKLSESRIDPMSLETYVRSGSPKSGRQKQLKDLIGDSTDHEHIMSESIFSGEIQVVLKRVLDEREREIVISKFGLGCPELSITAISNNTGLTKTKVSYILEKALEKLRLEVPEFEEFV